MYVFPFSVSAYTFLARFPCCCFWLLIRSLFSSFFNSGYRIPWRIFSPDLVSISFFILYPHVGCLFIICSIWMSSRFLVMCCTISFLRSSSIGLAFLCSVFDLFCWVLYVLWVVGCMFCYAFLCFWCV